VQIPRALQAEPVLSRLVSEHCLSLTIKGAWLGSNGQDDGWFDLLLEGSPEAFDGGLDYLRNLGVELWSDSPAEDW
jgi:hypothetical protein